MPFPSPTVNQRVRRLRSALRSRELEGLVVNAGPTLTYLTGLHFHLSERPVLAMFRGDSKAGLVVPSLEASKTEALPYEMEIFAYGEDPGSWPRIFQQAARAMGLEGERWAVEPRRLRVLELRMLESAEPAAAFVSGEGLIASLRARKDEAEIAAMREAARIAQQALQATLPQIRLGMTELELARELTWRLLQAGSDPELPFSPIVGFGENSANPHTSPTTRALGPDELVLLDWGANAGGYFSDITRVFVSGEPASQLATVAQVVAQANAAARALAAPGVEAGAVDQAAREVISQAGFGQYFIHRTGHGLGLEVHEEPYIRAGSDEPLEMGMAFTIEPGVYLPGQGGVRMEDNVVITGTGALSLTDLPRELVTVAG